MQGIKSFEQIRVGEWREDQSGVRESIDKYTIRFVKGVRDYGRLTKMARPDLLRWQPHEFDPQARVRNWTLTRRQHTNIADLDVEYSTEIPEPENPLDRRAKIEVYTSDVVLPILKDADGNPLMNKAGNFLEGMTETFSLLTFQVTKNVSGFPPWLLQEYPQAMNSDRVRLENLDLEKQTLKVGSIRIGSEQYHEDDDTAYRSLQLTLVHHPATWKQFVLNRGLKEVKLIRKPQANGGYRIVKTVVPILDDLGEPITEPQFLDADGRVPRVDSTATPSRQGKLVSIEQELRALQAGRPLETTIKTPLDPEDIITLEFKTRKSRPFAALPLR